MSVSLSGQSAVVVGASSGMGRAIAVALAGEGMRVLGVARRRGHLEALQREAGVEIAVADVVDRAAMDAVFRAAIERFGAVDVMVYSAGTNIPARAMTALTPETWDMMLAVNLTGAFNCTRAILPHMRERGAGHLIYISSIAAHTADASGASYQAAKRGVCGLAHAVRVEEKQHGIRTSVILPGLCKTDLVYRRPVPTPPEILDFALEPEDVADAVLAVARMHPRATVPDMELVPTRP